MIENSNVSKNPSAGEFTDIRKYIGVASISVLAINPNNDKLRKYGWTIPDDAAEPVYVTSKLDERGREYKNARVRFLVQIHDLEEKPIVALDFWCREGLQINRNGDKCQIIDSYGRTAWGTKDEIEAHKVPVYSNGQPASIATPYKKCHPGEDQLVNFLMKLLNVTPLQVYDRNKQSWVSSKNPGKLTIDNWTSLCSGDVSEIAEYCAMQPENKVKVVLGVRTTDENKTYQTFLNTGYIGNGAVPDRNSGEYPSARKLIDKFNEGRSDSPYTFSANPVKEWTETATVVQENTRTMFDDEGNFVADDDDLPFGD